MRLLNTETGELRPGRCRATNLCRYCQRLYVVETVEMLTLDAIEYAPTLWVVLTAREHLTRAECRDHLRQLLKAARKRWPGIEWFVQVEFQRRGALHLNLLVKGVPVEDVEKLRALFVDRWCSRVDAEPVGQWAGAIEDGVGCVRYLSKMLAHGLKAEQSPPIGWRGHRTSQTRGYLVRPASVMRVEARRALRVKRALHRGMDAGTAELEVAAAELVAWELRHVRPGMRLRQTDAIGRDPAGSTATVRDVPSTRASVAASSSVNLGAPIGVHRPSPFTVQTCQVPAREARRSSLNIGGAPSVLTHGSQVPPSLRADPLTRPRS
jgi:hypothetical protein